MTNINKLEFFIENVLIRAFVLYDYHILARTFQLS